MTGSWRLHQSPPGAPTRRVAAGGFDDRDDALVRAVAATVRDGLDREVLAEVTAVVAGGGRPPSSWLGWRFQRDVVGLKLVRFAVVDGRLRWTGTWSPAAVTVAVCHGVADHEGLRAAFVDGVVAGVPTGAVRSLEVARGLLGVQHGADRERIRRAFRDAVYAAHPDAGGVGADVAELVSARDALLDDASRR